jgi:hypothetical protein
LIAACLAAAPVLAQPQIGGGICSSATLNGTYSLTLSGRDVGSSVTFSKVTQGIGTATFDGLSKVTFLLTSNTNQAAGATQTLQGTYSMQANCIGTINITTGDSVTFTLEAYNEGKNYLITGQDATYALSGSGNLVPSTCSASMLNGAYSFNGTGFFLALGAISGVNDISGTLQLDGKSAISGTWFVSAGTFSTTATLTGQFNVTAACTGNASLTDTSGNTYVLYFTATTANGSNFILSGSSPAILFIGSGRTI